MIELKSNARAAAAAIRPLVTRSVHVQVWGADNRDSAGDAVLVVESVAAFGAGLLKQAPTSTDSGVEILEASYVQWNGKRLTRNPAAPALVLSPITQQ